MSTAIAEMPAPSERRADRRVPVRYPVEFSRLERGRKVAFGFGATRDACSGGLCLESPQATGLNPGDSLEVRVWLPLDRDGTVMCGQGGHERGCEGTLLLTCRAEVVHCRREGVERPPERRTLVGVRFCERPCVKVPVERGGRRLAWSDWRWAKDMAASGAVDSL